MTVHTNVRDEVAVITLDGPPVNALGLTTRRGIVTGVEHALADPGIRAIVLTGSGKAFSGGADINEFGSPTAFAEPSLLSVIRLLEDAPKPTVAAINGICMGGGFELALGCHFRLVAPGVSLAFPEVKLGLIPGAGGTQRLPRVLDVETALNLIVNGDPVTSDVMVSVAGQKLFDRIVDGDILGTAIAFARERADDCVRGISLPRVRDLTATHPEADGYFQFARNTIKVMAKHFPAPVKCVDAVEAAVKRTFEDGMTYERESFLALMQTPESKALRHVFLAERAARKIPDVPDDTPQRTIRKIGVIGAGTMGAGISVNFLNAGFPVAILEMKSEALERGVAGIRSIYDNQVKKGRLTPEQVEQRLGQLQGTLKYDDLKDADLVIEAVFEEMEVKRQVFEQLDTVCKPAAILATNTSTLDVDRIAAFTRRPQDVVGMHFFSPANVMKLLEVVRGEATSKDVLATVMKLAKTLRKTAVVSGVCDGFIGNRMIEQYSRQAGFLLEEGCTPAQVDKAIEKFGFAMGPFRMSDLAGNDIGWAIRKRRYVEAPDMRYSKTADLLCEMGRFGQKTSAGWYDYQKGNRDAIPSDVVVQMIENHRKELGITSRRINDDEIVHRLVYSLVNEGASIIEEGIATRASDIDIVYLTGYGFPVWRGGPMCYADTRGLVNVVHAMRRFAANPLDDSAFWQPAPLLARLAAEGETFT